MLTLSNDMILSQLELLHLREQVTHIHIINFRSTKKPSCAALYDARPIIIKGFILGYGLDGRYRVQPGSGAHPASYPMCTGGFSLGIKRPGPESDHSSPSSAEMKNDGARPSLPHGEVLN
jgi:hypothetical protein